MGQIEKKKEEKRTKGKPETEKDKISTWANQETLQVQNKTPAHSERNH